ncbi:hypothetical protein RR42_s1126 [Cupriavidus basilensis]|uniref:Uncharacterized protein n=1 Tax=Cupriavidus basilensis TaxID=68895 RepID=A0A0C4YJC2_9BURK|nr:hypothetical protein RR42_s1126 [Cupriavidus basilensis]
MLTKQVQPQLFRPPVAICRTDAGGMIERTLCFTGHALSPIAVALNA